MSPMPTMGILVTLLHVIIQHIINEFIDRIIVQKQIPVQTPN